MCALNLHTKNGKVIRLFRFKSGIDVSYTRQGYIYFVSRLYSEHTEDKKQKILNHCINCGGEYYKALFEYVTTDATATALSMRHYLSKNTLYRSVRKYYETFPKNL